MEYLEDRRDLAAAFRWFEKLNMHEGIANHFSLAVSSDDKEFLMNPFGKHWSQMKASDLLVMHCDQEPDDIGGSVDPTAWAIHGAVHRQAPHARCVMHVHSKYALALACLKDPVLPPIDQNTMRFFNRVAVDDGFDGMGLGEEGSRIASRLGNHSVMLMGNHGVMVATHSVAQALDDLYYFEKACETYIIALSTGKELSIVSDEIAEKTALQTEAYEGAAEKHLAAVRSVLEQSDASFLN